MNWTDPEFKKRANRQTFQFLLEKIDRKLEKTPAVIQLSFLASEGSFIYPNFFV